MTNLEQLSFRLEAFFITAVLMVGIIILHTMTTEYELKDAQRRIAILEQKIGK